MICSNHYWTILDITIHTHARTHARTHVYTRTHSHIRTHTCTHTYADAHSLMRTHARTHARTYTHAHIRTYAHTHARMHPYADAHSLMRTHTRHFLIPLHPTLSSNCPYLSEEGALCPYLMEIRFQNEIRNDNLSATTGISITGNYEPVHRSSCMSISL